MARLPTLKRASGPILIMLCASLMVAALYYSRLPCNERNLFRTTTVNTVNEADAVVLPAQPVQDCSTSAEVQQWRGIAEKYEKQLSEMKAKVSSLLNQTVLPQANAKEPTCIYGVGTSIGKREHQGKEIEYWRDTLDAIPDEVKVVAILNRLKRPVIHDKITHVIVPEDQQPEFDEELLMRPLKRNHGDSIERIKWRSSLSLDVARLMRFVSDRCKYALWLEDDALLSPDWFERVKRFTPQHDNWSFQSLSPSMIGVLFNSKHAYRLIQFIIHHFDEAPVDWTLNHYIEYMRKHFPQVEQPGRTHVIGHRGEISTLQEAEQRPVFH